MSTSYSARETPRSRWARVVNMSTFALLSALSHSVNAVVPSLPLWKPVCPGRPIDATLKQVQRPASSHRCGRGALLSSGAPASFYPLRTCRSVVSNCRGCSRSSPDGAALPTSDGYCACPWPRMLRRLRREERVRGGPRAGAKNGTLHRGLSTSCSRGSCRSSSAATAPSTIRRSRCRRPAACRGDLLVGLVDETLIAGSLIAPTPAGPTNAADWPPSCREHRRPVELVAVDDLRRADAGEEAAGLREVALARACRTSRRPGRCGTACGTSRTGSWWRRSGRRRCGGPLLSHQAGTRPLLAFARRWPRVKRVVDGVVDGLDHRAQPAGRRRRVAKMR